MDVFDYLDYRKFLKDLLFSREKTDKKIRPRILSHIRMSSSLFSQILKGEKNLSNEQAYDLAMQFSLSESETEYFILIAEFQRAGTEVYKKRLQKKINLLRLQAKAISAKVPKDISLTEEDKAIYYSHWGYTGVRNLLATPHGKDLKSLSERVQLPFEKIDHILQFLISIGLASKKEGKLSYQPGFTHLDPDSPLILRHHQNWRQKAIQRMDYYKEPHLHYTSPMSVSAEQAEKIRLTIRELITHIIQSAKGEQPDTGYCLNIDWFEY